MSVSYIICKRRASHLLAAHDGSLCRVYKISSDSCGVYPSVFGLSIHYASVTMSVYTYICVYHCYVYLSGNPTTSASTLLFLFLVRHPSHHQQRCFKQRLQLLAVEVHFAATDVAGAYNVYCSLSRVNARQSTYFVDTALPLRYSTK